MDLTEEDLRALREGDALLPNGRVARRSACIADDPQEIGASCSVCGRRVAAVAFGGRIRVHGRDPGEVDWDEVAQAMRAVAFADFERRAKRRLVVALVAIGVLVWPAAAFAGIGFAALLGIEPNLVLGIPVGLAYAVAALLLAARELRRYRQVIARSKFVRGL